MAAMYKLESSGPDTIGTEIDRIIQNGFPLEYFLPHLQALGVFPGLGEDSRYHHLQDLVRQAPKLQAVLAAGRHPNEQEGRFIESTEALRRLLGEPAPSRLYVQHNAEHMLHQAQWMVETAMRGGLRSLGLVVSWWQLSAAYKLVIKQLSFYKHGMIAVVPIPAPALFTGVVRETGHSVAMMLPGEIRREKRDAASIASDGEVLAYFRWLKGNMPGQ